MFQDGDFSDLFRVRVLGPGQQVEETQIMEQSSHESYALPVGTLYLEDAPLAEVELSGAHVLAGSRGSSQPESQHHNP